MSTLEKQPPWSPIWAWLCAALAGLILPATAMLVLANEPAGSPVAPEAAPLLAIGLMGAGMIGAAISGRFTMGVGIALIAGTILLLIAVSIETPDPAFAGSIALAYVIASISFAARGALFARSAGARGWWVALFVVSGEAAILITALAQPDVLPRWLLVLLPAQWTNMAIEAAFAGRGILTASSALIALAGTAAATLMVARLLPRRWPYLIMFTTWLALSALVWHWPPA